MSASGEWTWDKMLVSFRALGGVAENIRLGEGTHGRGLFPVNAAKPVFLRLPKNLLFPVDDIEFIDGRPRIRDATAIGRPERDFFAAYEESFSWGAGAREESANFVAAIDSLPAHVRTLLAAEFGLGELVEGDTFERTKHRFVKTRRIELDKTHAIMPLVDLANHDPAGAAYERDTDGGLLIRGTFKDEILVDYADVDSFGIFMAFGFASREPRAYSMPMTMKIEDGEVRIGRATRDHVQRGAFPTPRLKLEGNRRTLSYLMVGNSRWPKLSRGIADVVMKEARAPKPDELFDRILFQNRLKFLKLAAALEAENGDMVLTLRKMAHYQLEAMTHCIGTRAL